MSREYEVDESLIRAFHLMYDHYPEPVQLTHKSRTILAVNPAGLASGKGAGMVCSKLGTPGIHKGCLASEALEGQKATWASVDRTPVGGRKFVAFWLPIQGYPEYFVHFGCGTTHDYDAPS
jgi:hypothetical protein